MASYRCDHCLEVFSGKNAYEQIKTHVFECVISDYGNGIEELETELKAKFPQISEIEMRFHDFDTDDHMVVKRSDGAAYPIVYRSKTVRLNYEKNNEPEKTLFEILSERIEKTEKNILNFIFLIKDALPECDIRFAGGNEHLGLDFAFEADGATRVKTFYPHKHPSTWMQEGLLSIKPYFTNRVEGKIETFNQEIRIDGVLMNEWFARNRGKTCTIELNNVISM